MNKDFWDLFYHAKYLAIPGYNKYWYSPYAECAKWWSQRIVDGQDIDQPSWQYAQQALIMAAEVLSEG